MDFFNQLSEQASALADQASARVERAQRGNKMLEDPDVEAKVLVKSEMRSVVEGASKALRSVAETRSRLAALVDDIDAAVAGNSRLDVRERDEFSRLRAGYAASLAAFSLAEKTLAGTPVPATASMTPEEEDAAAILAVTRGAADVKRRAEGAYRGDPAPRDVPVAHAVPLGVGEEREV